MYSCNHLWVWNHVIFFVWPLSSGQTNHCPVTLIATHATKEHKVILPDKWGWCPAVLRTGQPGYKKWKLPRPHMTQDRRIPFRIRCLQTPPDHYYMKKGLLFLLPWVFRIMNHYLSPLLPADHMQGPQADSEVPFSATLRFGAITPAKAVACTRHYHWHRTNVIGPPFT